MHRRRCGQHHSVALEHAWRWPVTKSRRPVHAAFGRRRRRGGADRCAGQHLGGGVHERPCHRLRLHEGAGRHRDDGAWHGAVGIHHAGNVGRVVDVVDDRVVDYGVAVVDLGHIGAAGGIGRLVHLARRQREPGDTATSLIAAGHTKAKVGAAHKHDQRRCVPGRCGDRARHPGPVVAQVGPAPVVGHREAPWGVVHPGPAPRIDPDPVAVAVRCPAGRHPIWHPHMAVSRVVAPTAVGIQVLVTDDIARYITRGH